MLGVGLLLTERLVECRNAADDADGHETEGDQRPNDTPALG
jgi:hypothetical protein